MNRSWGFKTNEQKIRVLQPKKERCDGHPIWGTPRGDKSPLYIYVKRNKQREKRWVFNDKYKQDLNLNSCLALFKATGVDRVPVPGVQTWCKNIGDEQHPKFKAAELRLLMGGQALMARQMIREGAAVGTRTPE